ALAFALPWLGHALVHGAPLVAVANIFLMWICGARLESRAGPLRFGLFLALVTLTGAFVELWFVHDPTPALGASATLAGVMVAYLLFHFGARARVVFPVLVWPVFFDVPVLVLVLAWIAAQVPRVGLLLSAPGSRSHGVLALGAGAAAGFVLAPLLLGLERARGRGSR
ncbi:MAG: rhomboid family intramembrane serine protease, partial [Planctomycetes bacterium]|nr:rhomboid family intramembrane serine protease [Planctomycetota bacterium]